MQTQQHFVLLAGTGIEVLGGNIVAIDLLSGSGIAIVDNVIAIEIATFALISGAQQKAERNQSSGYAGLDAAGLLVATQIDIRASTGLQVINGRTLALSSQSQTDLAGAQQTSEKDLPNGYAGLDANGHSLASQIDPTTAGLINGAEQVSQKDQLSGYAGIGPDGSIPATLILRVGIAADIDLLTLENGELAWCSDTKSYRIGDGITQGGYRLNTQNVPSNGMIAVDATGTAVQNGNALRNAYEAAKLLTPNGAALSATNKATLAVRAGVYEIDSGGWVMNSPYVQVWGQGSEFTAIVTIGTITINSGNYNSLKGIRFTGNNDGVTAANIGLTLQAPAGGITIAWEDLFFDTNGSNTSFAMNSPTGVTTANTLKGYAKRCRTVGQRFLGNGNAMACATTFVFEDCEAGSFSFLGSSTTTGNNPGLMAGTMRRCRMNMASGTQWWVRPGLGTVLDGCVLKGTGIPRFSSTGAIIQRCTIVPESGPCFADTAAIYGIAASFNNLKTFGGASPYGGTQTPTNSLGDSVLVAQNVHSDTVVA
jgi:hypothetical protein